MPNFQKLNLLPEIIKTLEKKGYVTPTPIQAQAIPHLLEGKDLLGIAQTGTGKTAAFSLPIIDRLFRNKRQVSSNQIRTLILTPTRELATQIGDNISLYSKGLGLKHAVIFGGVNESSQIKTLKAGIDILIATPGRLLDLATQGHIRFSQIEIFVLDEADRMLDMGFINDVKKIISKLPSKKQCLLFSATMPEAISGLAHSILNNPIKIEITPQSTTVERINQKLYLVDKSNKPALLLDVLTKNEVVSALVFSKTKHGANKVVTHLEKYGVTALAIHGNKSQPARERALKDFREGKIKVLIATDIAARGIDVPNISHVINYDIPVDPESYVHRIGRTARAGREGVAISFCDFSENLYLRAIEKTIRMKIPVDNSHAFHGKTATQDVNEGRLLSRGTNNKFVKKTKNDENLDKRKTGFKLNTGNNLVKRKSETSRIENLDKRTSESLNVENSSHLERKRESNSNRNYNKSLSSKSSKNKTRTGNFSKGNKNEENSFFGENSFTKTSKSLAKKVLNKFGFKKFDKKNSLSDNLDQNNSNFSKTRSNNKGTKFSKNRNNQGKYFKK
jgi:ATP-dependent RNA helicase RhlE